MGNDKINTLEHFIGKCTWQEGHFLSISLDPFGSFSAGRSLANHLCSRSATSRELDRRCAEECKIEVRFARIGSANRSMRSARRGCLLMAHNALDSQLFFLQDYGPFAI